MYLLQLKSVISDFQCNSIPLYFSLLEVCVKGHFLGYKLFSDFTHVLFLQFNPLTESQTRTSADLYLRIINNSRMLQRQSCSKSFRTTENVRTINFPRRLTRTYGEDRVLSFQKYTRTRKTDLSSHLHSPPRIGPKNTLPFFDTDYYSRLPLITLRNLLI